MNKLTLALTLMPLALLAQPRETVSHTYEFKTLDERANSSMLTLIQSYFPGRVNATWVQGIHALVLRGPAADVEAAEALLAKYDIPPREVEFTAWVVRALKTSAGMDSRQISNPQLLQVLNDLARIDGQIAAMKTAVGANNPAMKDLQSQRAVLERKKEELEREQEKAGGPSLPAALAPALTEMKQTFGYQSFEMLDTVVTRTKSHAEIENTLAVPNTSYSISFDGVTVSGEGKIVNVPRFAFRLASRAVSLSRLLAKTDAPVREPVSSIENEVTLHGDERLVLGKLRLPNSTGDIFVVLTAKPL